MPKDNRFHPPGEANNSPHAKAKEKGKPPAFDDAQAAGISAEFLHSGKLPSKATLARLPLEFRQLCQHIRAAGQSGAEEWAEDMRACHRDDPDRLAAILGVWEAESSSVGSVGSRGVGDGENSTPETTSDGGYVGSVGSPLPLSPQFEGEPRKIDADLMDVPALDMDLVPLPLRTWAQDIAERGSFPVEYPAVTILVVLSCLLARRLAIRPKRHDNWLVIVNLWGLLVGKAGMTKTPSVDESMVPFDRLARRASEAFEQTKKAAAVEAIVRDAKKTAAAAALKKAAADKSSSIEQLREIAADVAEEYESPKPRRYKINDTSIEKLGEMLRDSPSCPLMFRDEIDGLFATFGKEGHESDRKFYLECWGGNGSYTFDRIGRGTTHVKSMCLAMLGTIQPGPLSHQLKGSIAGTKADGFMNRFQLVVYPDAPAYVHTDRRPDPRALADACNVFEWLDTLEPSRLDALYDEAKEIHFLQYADDAQTAADDWHVENQNRCRGGIESPIMSSHLSKYSSLMPSLALIHHAVESVGMESIRPVSLRSVEVAIAWCRFFEAHTRRIYQAAAEGDPASAARLSERLARLSNPFTPRQVVQKGWAGLDTTDDVMKALGVLEDRNHVKSEEVRNEEGGRPSLRFYIHPSIAPPAVAL